LHFRQNQQNGFQSKALGSHIFLAEAQSHTQAVKQVAPSQTRREKTQPAFKHTH
jgi:hypothetical protein